MKKGGLGRWAMAGVLLFAIALRAHSTPSAGASYLVLAVYAVFGHAHAIHALAMSWLFSMLSPGIVAETTLASAGRYTVLASAAMSVLLRGGLLRRGYQISIPVLASGILGLFIVVHSIMFSAFVEISILKAISWTVATITIFAAWGGLAPGGRVQLSREMFGGLVALMLVSLPLLPSELGYLRNGTGFQGALGHPQAFGPTMALLGTWAGSRVLTDARPPWALLGVFGTCVALIVLSEARTAGVALLMSLLLVGLIVPAFARKHIHVLMPGLRSPRVYVAIGLSIAAAMIAGPILSERMGQYFAKRLDPASLVEAYDESRGELIRQMTANIALQPWTGIGFGVGSFPEDMSIERDQWLGLPTGAPVEKGVLPIAVIEELGIPGLFAVIVWLWILVARAVGTVGVVAPTVFACAILINLGEATLFSPGGMGLLSLILIGWAITEGDVRGHTRASA